MTRNNTAKERNKLSRCVSTASVYSREARSLCLQHTFFDIIFNTKNDILNNTFFDTDKTYLKETI